jgi:phosphate transport system protein
MNVHTHKQFDNEMEAVRSGVLAMGGLVEAQLRRAIACSRPTTATRSRR